MRTRAEDSLGSFMLFEMADVVKELMTEINDEVLAKIDAIEEEKKIDTSL